jgi:hypothetical protein
MIYLVQELSAGKWYTVRSFMDKEEAESFREWMGYKARIKTIKN